MDYRIIWDKQHGDEKWEGTNVTQAGERGENTPSTRKFTSELSKTLERVKTGRTWNSKGGELLH